MKELGDNYLPGVKDQYEDYPYPPRDPDDDRHRLVKVLEEMLPRVNHYCFQGRSTFRDFRVLVAGGGTGDASIYLALQLAELGGHVTHLDLSASSIAIARQRAGHHGLSNITFLQRSLMDLPSLGIGPFDYINCCGVLHHLADPDAGLSALKAVLKPHGAMSLMLYGKVARTPVYLAQDLLRLITADVAANADKVSLSRQTLAALPEENYFKRAEYFSERIPRMDDIALYDLLLHSQDRAYSIPELYAYVARAGLHIAAFSNPIGRSAYDPIPHLKDPELRERVAGLPLPERQAIGELMTCQASKHCIYVTAERNTQASPMDQTNIPFYHFHPTGIAFNRELPNLLREHKGRPLTLHVSGETKITLEATPRNAAFLEAIDGERSIREVVALVRTSETDASEDELSAHFRQFFAVLNECDAVLLRAPEAGQPIRYTRPSAMPSKAGIA